MRIIEKYLSLEDLELIRSLLGQKIYQVYSKAIRIDVNENEFESSSFSLSVENGFLNFHTSWIDKSDYEYYKLKLSQSESPFGIERTHDGALIDPSVINMTPVSKVKSIELFAVQDVEEINRSGRELITIKYDSALLFRQEDGNSFLIGVSKTIADLTSFIRNYSKIEEKISRLEKRIEWK